MARHLRDLSTDTYEGLAARSERFGHFLQAIELATPVATTVLEAMNQAVLGGTGTVGRDPLPDFGAGLDSCRWTLEWPLQHASVSRVTGLPLEPVAINVAFPPDYTHPHLGESKPSTAPSIWAWPFQVSAHSDAESLRPVLETIAAASLHERIFQSDIGWRVVPLADELGLTR